MADDLRIKVYEPKAILIQMFGLMAPERWREESGLPFVRANLSDLLNRKTKEGKVQILIEGLRALARQDAEVDDSTPLIEDDSAPSDDVISSVIAFMEWQHARGRSNRTTRTLENLLMSDGIGRGALKLTLYDDVVPALMEWHQRGCRIFVDCPHLSADEARLYMQNTDHGDAAQFVEGFFGNDKTFMATEAAKSYANMLSVIGIPVSDILLVTYIGQRAKQMADDFKIPVLLVDRNDNRKIRKYYLFRFRCVFKLTQARFIKRPLASAQQAAAATAVAAAQASGGGKSPLVSRPE